MNPLYNIPGLGGYVAAQDARDNRELTDAKKAEAVMGILSTAYKMQKDQEQLQAIQRMLPRGALSTTPNGVLAGGAVSPEIPVETLMQAAASGVNIRPFLRINEQAEQLRQRRESAATVEGFKSSPGVLGAGVTTNSEQGRALMSNMTGDGDFDSAVLRAQNEALNSNQRLQPQAVQAPRQGLFAPLVDSPHVGPYARNLQTQLDSARGGVNPQNFLTQYNNLLQQHTTSSNQEATRQASGDLRRDLSAQSDATRRELAAQSDATRRELAEASRSASSGRQSDLEAQRTFTRERSLANDYNKLAEDFRTVLPAFQSSAQYVASAKYDSSGDRALAFSFARTLDPKDRVGVRDIADINRLGNVPERVKQALVGLSEGKMLPDRVRLEMFDVMRRTFENMNSIQEQIENEYEQRAQSYMVRPHNVVTRYSLKRGQGNDGWGVKEK